MDVVADFITIIKNAGSAGLEKVDVPSSNLRKGVAEVLKKNGYIRDYKVVKDSKQGIMRIYLKYSTKKKFVIEEIKKVSKSSKRVYVSLKNIPKVRSGYGISILSTNKGILSGKDAVKENVGGEYLIKVW